MMASTIRTMLTWYPKSLRIPKDKIYFHSKGWNPDLDTFFNTPTTAIRIALLPHAKGT